MTILIYNVALTLYIAFPCCVLLVFLPFGGDVNDVIVWMAIDFLVRLCLLGAIIGVLRWNKEAVWVYWIFVLLLLFWSVANDVHLLWFGSLNVLFAIVLTAVLWKSRADWRNFE